MSGKRYTEEFKIEAVKQVSERGHLVAEAARRLSIPVGSLKNWLVASGAGKLQEVGQAQKPLTDAELELARSGRAWARHRIGPRRMAACNCSRHPFGGRYRKYGLSH